MKSSQDFHCVVIKVNGHHTETIWIKPQPQGIDEEL